MGCRCVRGRWPSWTLWAAKCWIRGSTIWGVVPRNSNPITFTTIINLNNCNTPKMWRVILVSLRPPRLPSRDRVRIADTNCLGHRLVHLFQINNVYSSCCTRLKIFMQIQLHNWNKRERILNIIVYTFKYSCLSTFRLHFVNFYSNFLYPKCTNIFVVCVLMSLLFCTGWVAQKYFNDE